MLCSRREKWIIICAYIVMVWAAPEDWAATIGALTGAGLALLIFVAAMWEIIAPVE